MKAEVLAETSGFYTFDILYTYTKFLTGEKFYFL